ncbi:MAG: type IV secretion system DNA-binding domain-containing protein [Bacteroidota bacterium]
MSSSRSLSDQFPLWEAWGRGWLKAPQPVELEPPCLAPPWWHRQQRRDDTKRESWFSRLAAKPSEKEPRSTFTEQASNQLLPVEEAVEYVELGLSLPVDGRLLNQAMWVWLSMLGGLQNPASLELLAGEDIVELRLAVAGDDIQLLVGAFASVAPQVELIRTGPLVDELNSGEGENLTGFEFGLAAPFIIPLAPAPKGLDRLTALIRVLGSVPAGDRAVLQFLFQPTRNDWEQAIRYGLHNEHGQPLIADPAAAKLIEAKAASEHFAVAIRLLTLTEDQDAGFLLAETLHAALNLSDAHVGNTLVPLSDTDLNTLIPDVLERRSHRLGMVLTTDELASLIDLPDRPETLPQLWRYEERRGVPTGEDTGIELGTTEEDETLSLSTSDRLKHLHVLGATGTGKSNFLLSLIKQDLEAGHGFALLDPHGDLVEGVATLLSEADRNRTVFLDPTDSEYATGWNVLGANSQTEADLLSSDLVAVFERLATSWGDQMTSVLGNAVMTLLEAPEPTTLVELRRFLIDENYRAELLATISDPFLREYWEVEWPLISGRKPQAPILTRLDTLLRQRSVREALTLTGRALDFRAVMDEGQILLAKLPRGLIGAETSSLLGALLLSKLYQTGLSRQDIGVSARRPFFVYIDEFQSFATPSVATLFSELRKYGLGLVIAHQDLSQLSSTGAGVERAVMGNSYARVAFRVSERDARTLAPGFAHYESSNLTSLQVGEAIARLGSSQTDFRIRTPYVEVEKDADAALEALRGTSNAKHATSRTELRAARERARTTSGRVSKPEPKPSKPSVASTPNSVEPPVKRPPRIETPRRVTPAKPSEPVSTPKLDTSEGRGGPEHRYLQSLLRSAAQARGHLANLEVELDDGGRVDLVIERTVKGKRERIAVEISITTKFEHELENARKCLAADFDYVALVTNKARLRKRLEAALKAEDQNRLLVTTPEGFLDWLSDSPVSTGTIAGYVVTTKAAGSASTSSDKLSQQSVEERRERLNEIIAKSLSRMKKGG